jgi:hypothetical protein
VAVLGSAVWAAGPAAASAGPAVLAFTPSPVDYGQVAVGNPASQMFTLANTGGRAVRGLTVTVSGSAAFTITASTCTAPRLGPGTSCTVTVQFAPAGTGLAAATLTAANSKKAVLATDAVTGTGGAAASHLYWADDAADTITEAGLDGTGAQVIASLQAGPEGVAVGGSHLYWATLGNGTSGTIVEANLNGTGAHAIVSGLSFPIGVAVNASHLYWSTRGSGAANTGTIVEANLDGTGVQVIASAQNGPYGVAVDASHLYWANQGADTNTGTIMEAGLGGTGVQVIASLQNFPHGVAVGPQ